MEPTHPPLSDEAFAKHQVPAYIDGAFKILTSKFPVTSPYNTTTPAWHCSSASVSDALRCVEAAAAAFPAWSQTKGTARRDILLKAAQLMEERADELAKSMCTEMGANVGASAGFIVPLGVSMVRDCAARISGVEGMVPEVGLEGQSAMVFQVPVGVVLGIVPWNAPYVFGARSIATALAAGCTTVIKASELTPRSYMLMAQCFHDAGVPKGVLNMISSPPANAAEVTNAMIAHPAVRKVNFTGSTNVGRKIAVECASHLKPCLMELGGKNAALVLADANLELAATQCVLGGFLNSGQICMSTDRIIVDRSVASKFRDVLSVVMGRLFPATNAAPTLVNAASLDRINGVIDDAKAQGARVLEAAPSQPGQGSNSNHDEKSIVLRPAILTNITPKMSVWEDENFASVVALTEAADDEEAIAIANSTGYGLSAAVFSEDWRRAMRVAKRLESGAVHINSMTVHDEPALPFGGVKASGWGRFNGRQGMEEFLVTKSITWMD